MVLHFIYTFIIRENMEEKEILRDLVIDSLNLSRKLIRESTELKLNKNTVYQSCINDYCMKL